MRHFTSSRATVMALPPRSAYSPCILSAIETAPRFPMPSNSGCAAVDQYPARHWRGPAARAHLPAARRLTPLPLFQSDLQQGIIDDRFRALMTFQIARARALYAEAWAGIRLLAPEGRLAIAAAADLYRAILREIERNGYDVFNRRAHLSAAQKLARLPWLWWNVQRM